MDFKALQKSTDLYLILGENHITEKQKLEPANHYKPALFSVKLQKHVTSMSSRDAGQRIPCFDRCVFDENAQRISVDGRSKRIEIFAC